MYEGFASEVENGVFKGIIFKGDEAEPPQGWTPDDNDLLNPGETICCASREDAEAMSRNELSPVEAYMRYWQSRRDYIDVNGGPFGFWPFQIIVTSLDVINHTFEFGEVARPDEKESQTQSS